MKLIRTEDAVGSVLCHDITQIIPGVVKDAVFRKGHVVTEEDVPVLLSVGKEHLYVWEKQEGMLHENDAAEVLRQVCQGEHMNASEAKEGKIELTAQCDGLLKINREKFRVFELLDADTKTELYCKDGDEVKNGQLMGKVTGDIRVLLSGERVALNYLQRMSGIATYTHSVAGLLEGSKTKLLDTRKTTPNMRIFEKYAVRVGGGYNHRYNLSDGVLLKDNHIGAAGSVKKAVEMAKDYAPFVRKIEVEVENLEMVKEAVEAGADIIMLDNMSTEEMQEAIKIIDGRAETECSGNVTKENIGRLTALGVDYISSGALTHSAPILDISMKNLHAVE